MGKFSRRMEACAMHDCGILPCSTRPRRIISTRSLNCKHLFPLSFPLPPILPLPRRGVNRAGTVSDDQRNDYI